MNAEVATELRENGVPMLSCDGCGGLARPEKQEGAFGALTPDSWGMLIPAFAEMGRLDLCPACVSLALGLFQKRR